MVATCSRCPAQVAVSWDPTAYLLLGRRHMARAIAGAGWYRVAKAVHCPACYRRAWGAGVNTMDLVNAGIRREALRVVEVAP